MSRSAILRLLSPITVFHMQVLSSMLVILLKVSYTTSRNRDWPLKPAKSRAVPNMPKCSQSKNAKKRFAICNQETVQKPFSFFQPLILRGTLLVRYPFHSSGSEVIHSFYQNCIKLGIYLLKPGR